MFIQFIITLNGVTVTQDANFYQNRAYLETLLTYGTNAVSSHLTNEFWYLDNGDMLPCDPTKALSKKKGFIKPWNRIKESKEFQIYGRIHNYHYNVAKHLISGVNLQIKFTKTKTVSFLMNTNAESKTTFKFLYAYLIVNRIRANPAILLAHNTNLNNGAPAIYNLMRVKIKAFTSSNGSQSLPIYNAGLEQLQNVFYSLC